MEKTKATPSATERTDRLDGALRNILGWADGIREQSDDEASRKVAGWIVSHARANLEAVPSHVEPSLEDRLHVQQQIDEESDDPSTPPSTAATPRTDEFFRMWKTEPIHNQVGAFIEHARTLERELAVAEDANRKWFDQANSDATPSSTGRACACTFDDGVIVSPCEEHKAWKAGAPPYTPSATRDTIEALRPFARYHAMYLAEDHAPDSKLVFSHTTLGDYRRAAAIVAASDGNSHG